MRASACWATSLHVLNKISYLQRKVGSRLIEQVAHQARKAVDSQCSRDRESACHSVRNSGSNVNSAERSDSPDRRALCRPWRRPAGSSNQTADPRHSILSIASISWLWVGLGFPCLPGIAPRFVRGGPGGDAGLVVACCCACSQCAVPFAPGLSCCGHDSSIYISLPQ